MAHKICVLIAAVYSKNVQHGNRDRVQFERRSSESIAQILDPIGIIQHCCNRRAFVPESTQSKDRYDGEKGNLIDGKGVGEAHIVDPGESLE